MRNCRYWLFFILEEDMSNRCVDCKFHYSGYEWDEVDEENYLIDICVEGHTEYIESSEECHCFMNAKKRDD